MAAAGTNPRELDVTWTAVADADGYRVQWKAAGEEYDDNRQATVSGGTTASYTLTGLTGGAQYTVRVRAYREHADDGPWSADATGTPTAPAAGTPYADQVVVASTPASGNTYRRDEVIRVNVRFRPRVVVTGQPQLTLRVGSNDRQAAFRFHNTSIGGISVLAFEYTVTASDVDADGISFRADALNLNGGTITSVPASEGAGVVNADLATTIVPDDPVHKVKGPLDDPLAPTNLTAAAGATTITLTWDAPADAAGTATRPAVSGYRVEVSADAGATWTELTTIADAATTTYRHAGLAVGTTRHYRVIATSSGGDSPPSNTASATTLVAPWEPADLTATATGPTTIDLTWTAPAADAARAPVTGYRVEVSAYERATWTELTTIPAPRIRHQHAELTLGTTRHYRVIATSDAGDSAPSNTASATTVSAAEARGPTGPTGPTGPAAPTAAPLAPTGLSAMADGQTKIDLSWTAPAASATRAAVSGYRVEWSADGSTGWTAIAPNLGASATTLRAHRAQWRHDPPLPGVRAERGRRQPGVEHRVGDHVGRAAGADRAERHGGRPDED